MKGRQSQRRKKALNEFFMLYEFFENTSFNSAKEVVDALDELIKKLCRFGQGHKDLTVHGKEILEFLKEQ
jgi:hypothetical protein